MGGLPNGQQGQHLGLNDLFGSQTDGQGDLAQQAPPARKFSGEETLRQPAELAQQV